MSNLLVFKTFYYAIRVDNDPNLIDILIILMHNYAKELTGFLSFAFDGRISWDKKLSR